MTFEYRERIAVVTGASSGIGRCIALDLAGRGTTVVCIARRPDLIEEVARACRRSAPDSTAITLDVSDRAALERAMSEVLDRFGRVDVLVNNAGIPMRVHGSRLRAEQVESAMAVNFYGAVYATLALLPSMIERRRGDVVNVSSAAGRVASPRESAYTASKHALSGWSDAMAADLLGTGVRFHLVNPGPIDTEIWQKLDEPAAYHGRFHPPAEVADAVRACLERGRYERWVPRSMRVLPIFRALFPTLYVRAAGRFDARGAGRR